MKCICRKCQLAFTADSPRCPSCKSLQMVYPVSLVHLVVDDPNGSIKSAYGASRVLCGDITQPSESNDVHWTPEKSCVTCDRCLELIKSSLPEAEGGKPLDEEELKWLLEHPTARNNEASDADKAADASGTVLNEAKPCVIAASLLESVLVNKLSQE